MELKETNGDVSPTVTKSGKPIVENVKPKRAASKKASEKVKAAAADEEDVNPERQQKLILNADRISNLLAELSATEK